MLRARSNEKNSDSAIWSVAGLLVLYELPLWLQRAQWKTWVTSAWPRDIFRSPSSLFFCSRRQEAALDGRITAMELTMIRYLWYFVFPSWAWKPSSWPVHWCSLTSALPKESSRQTTRSDTTGTSKAKWPCCLIPRVCADEMGWIEPSGPRRRHTCRHSHGAVWTLSLAGHSVWPKMIKSVCYSLEGLSHWTSHDFISSEGWVWASDNRAHPHPYPPFLV